LKFFKLCAEHGSARSYIIYLLFLNGKMHFYEIIKNLQMHPKHIHRVLKELKTVNIVNVDDYGCWFLTR
jgi:DNA-binding HxlR family transcriptional regulator